MWPKLALNPHFASSPRTFAFAICTNVEPTPPLAECTRSSEFGGGLAKKQSAYQAVEATAGKLAASAKLNLFGRSPKDMLLKHKQGVYMKRALALLIT